MSQVIITTDIEKKLAKLAKELSDIKKEIKTAVKVSRSQVWFWSKGWQRKEKAADRAIKEGKTHTYSSVEDLIDSLHN